jgi:hypothetical protein
MITFTTKKTRHLNYTSNHIRYLHNKIVDESLEFSKIICEKKTKKKGEEIKSIGKRMRQLRKYYKLINL